MSTDNTGGRDKSRVFEWEDGWTRTAKHLPLSPGVQAALGVLALPTQEECDMLQPGRAKLRVSEYNRVRLLWLSKKKPWSILPSIKRVSTVIHWRRATGTCTLQPTHAATAPAEWLVLVKEYSAPQFSVLDEFLMILLVWAGVKSSGFWQEQL